MTKIFLPVLLIVIFLFVIFNFVASDLVILPNSKFSDSSDLSLLILGKPGPGYIGSENTDSIMVIHYDQKSNKVFLIPIPRDLIVQDEKGNLEKINTLYGENKINLLLKKATEFTGFDLRNYFVVDLSLVTKLVDFLGGLEVDLPYPVTDAVTLYTLPAGKHNLSGYFVELVLRSRYHPEGDFFRIKNQIEVLKALKNKLISLNTQEKIQVVKFLEENRYHWQSNLSQMAMFNILTKIKNPGKIEIVPIIIDLKSGLLASGYFTIKNSNNVYGIYPIGGIDNFRYLRNFIQSQVREFKK